jgi:hypothetical protein
MPVLTKLEMKLINEGMSALSIMEMNNLIMFIANKKGIAYSDINDTTIIDHHKEVKIGLFSDLCQEDIVKGFTSTNGHTYRTNDKDQANMIGKAVELILNPAITTVKWKTEDVGYVNHTKEDWITQVFSEGIKHKEFTLFKYDSLKTDIEEATSDPELVTIVW